MIYSESSSSIPPSSYNEMAYRQYLLHAQHCLEEGNPGEARNWLERAALLRRDEARLWLLRARAAEDDGEREAHLRRALVEEPAHGEALRELAILRGELDPAELIPIGGSVAPRAPDKAEAGALHPFLCPHCGGARRFDLSAGGLHCARCGTAEPIQAPMAHNDEQPLARVLPTVRGHRWAEAVHRLHCAQCGADSLLPPTQRSNHCPFCGTPGLVAAPESATLLEPQGIAPMQLNEDEATARAQAWLDGALGRQGHPARLLLRPAYYPFWTFDALYAARWVEEQATPSGRVERYEMGAAIPVDDILVAGSSQLEGPLLALAGSFAAKQVLAFRPEFVAGWPLLLYDLSLADASLRARGHIVERARALIARERHRSYLPGRFEQMSYKQLFFPLWVGHYELHGQRYRLVVNGQSHHVGGELPPQG